MIKGLELAGRNPAQASFETGLRKVNGTPQGVSCPQRRTSHASARRSRYPLPTAITSSDSREISTLPQTAQAGMWKAVLLRSLSSRGLVLQPTDGRLEEILTSAPAELHIATHMSEHGLSRHVGIPCVDGLSDRPVLVMRLTGEL